ncbi:SusC/RagA family TonB-linked outer membrane protein [Alistipes provencensis]|uniref:SusC/RagA family TonB-linked outer membrane protein n=1 Tax=Alistipes provencensis TaxID=1816676 RepID=UPI0009EE5FAB|nr:TonB-dependent receptor [Alistipes provencensis]
MKKFYLFKDSGGSLPALCSLLLAVLLISPIQTETAYGQQSGSRNITVRGTVSDENGTPMIGVAIVVKGPGRGTTTGADGKYSISASADATLLYTFIGYEPFEATVGNQTTINVRMKPSALKIDDVVVTGYGNIRRSDVTGSVASVSGATLAKIPSTSVSSALAGKMPGVQVTTADGSLDAEISIRVRGGGSITQDNSPLFIVDGFPVDDISTIPPSDIESIDVLKEASMTAIYGAQGANGVLIITTKRARTGRTTVSLNSYIQIHTLAKKLDLMNPYEFAMMEYEYNLIRNGNTSTFESYYGKFDDLDIYKSVKGDDWQDDILGGNPISQYYNLTIGGGNEKTRFNITYTHNNDKGQLVGTGLMRNNINLKLDHNLRPNLVLSTNSTFTHRRIDGAGTAPGGTVMKALRYRPVQGLRAGGSEIYDEDEELDENGLPISSVYKPSEDAVQNYQQRKLYQVSTKGSISWDIIKNLTFRSEYGFNLDVTGDDRFYGTLSNMARGAGMNNLPSAQRTNGQKYSYRFANTLSYRTRLAGSHNLNILLGQEINHSQSESTFASARYFPATITAESALNNFSRGTPYITSSEKGTPVRMASFFGRILYNYRNRYYATFTMRADGSTKFAPGKQWGYFPGGSVAWKISEERFLKNAKAVSELKLRLSYGLAGNNRISDDLWRQTYSITTDGAPGFNNQDYSYYQFSNTQYLFDPSLKWETTVTRNAGVDFGFFDNRLTGTVDVYWNTTKDLLVPSDIPNSSGYLKQLTNMGQTSNRGIEIQLNGSILRKKDLTLDVNFNIGFNKNRIDKLASGENEWRIKSGSSEWFTSYDYKMEVGRQMGLIYGFVNDGFYKISDFHDYEAHNAWVLNDKTVNCGNISNWPLQPGSIKFRKISPVDESAANPYLLTEDDITEIGNTNPKFSGGFGLTMTYKGIDLTAFFNFMYGFDVYNINKMYLNSMWRHNYYNLSSEMNGRFTYMDQAGNDLRTNPTALAERNKNAKTYSPLSVTSGVPMSDLIEDGSFLRLNTLTLGYTLPQRITRKFGVEGLRVYVSGYNLWTWTGYSGFDPEVNIQKGLTPGMDYNVYPRSRTFTAGIELKF